MPSKSVYERFLEIAEDQIERAIAEAEDLPQPSTVDPDLVTKPVSMRLPMYKIAALDAVALKMGLNRQELLVSLIENALPSAIAGYVYAWNSVGNKPNPESHLYCNEFVNEMEGISDRTRLYLHSMTSDGERDHD